MADVLRQMPREGDEKTPGAETPGTITGSALLCRLGVISRATGLLVARRLLQRREAVEQATGTEVCDLLRLADVVLHDRARVRRLQIDRLVEAGPLAHFLAYF